MSLFTLLSSALVPPAAAARPGTPAAAGRPLPFTRDVTLAFRMTHAMAVLLLSSSIAGLLYGPRGWWYNPDPQTLPAFLGQDAITLLVVVPLLVVSAVLAARGSLRGALCWMGTMFYVAYAYYFYVVGGRFNAFFPLYIALVSMGTYGSLAVFFSLDLSHLPERFDHLPVRTTSAFLLALALFFAGLWLSIIDAHLTTARDIDAISRTVIAVDGIVLLPLLFFAGRALARRDPIGYALAGLLLVKAAATFLTLIVNSALAQRWGTALDPVEGWAYVIGFLATLALLVRYLWSIQEAPAADATHAA